MPCRLQEIRRPRRGNIAAWHLHLYANLELISLCVSVTQTTITSDVGSAGFENLRIAGPSDTLHQEVLGQRCASNGAVLESGDPDAHERSTGMGGSDATGYENNRLG